MRKVTVYGRADGGDHARGGSRAGGGGGQAARDQRADDLHVAQAVRRVAGERCRRLKQLEAENARLKKLVAERDLEIEVMKESRRKKMVSVPARRQQVAYAPGAWPLGSGGPARCSRWRDRRCTIAVAKAAKDAPVLARMTELSAQYPRYGYRRIRIFLGRDGHAHELRPGAPAVAGGAAAGAAQAAKKAHRDRPAHARKRRRGRTRCGRTTSCSTIAPTASSSSA